MFEEVTGRAEEQDIIIKAAAVADYRPRYVSDEKVKKKDDDLALEMERTDDILAYLGAHKTKDQFLCGFSMETENEEKEPGHDYSKQFENGRRRVWREYECGYSDHRRF